MFFRKLERPEVLFAVVATVSFMMLLSGVFFINDSTLVAISGIALVLSLALILIYGDVLKQNKRARALYALIPTVWLVIYITIVNAMPY